ncbi:MAG: hypothetical protein M1833_001538 [Piccolia ochrophora]|nr:MAG: hypothetical protein M1833_001538 [Piccolia ochrophora]
MSTPEEAVYVNGNFSEPLAAQHEFQNKYDLDDPSSAMTSYSRLTDDDQNYASTHEATNGHGNTTDTAATRRAWCRKLVVFDAGEQ